VVLSFVVQFTTTQGQDTHLLALHIQNITVSLTYFRISGCLPAPNSEQPDRSRHISPPVQLNLSLFVRGFNPLNPEEPIFKIPEIEFFL
jgi:hypothetical protein